MENKTFKLKRTLQEMGITPDIKGYHYLAEAISIKQKANTEKDFNKPVMEIYKEIADKFNATGARVERAIRHAVERSFSTMNPVIHAIFDPVMSAYSGKVTNSCFIAMLAEYNELPESEE